MLASYARSAGGALLDKVSFWLVFAAAAFTPIYMFRLFFNVFCLLPPPTASVLYRRLWSLPTIASFHGLKSPAAMCWRAIVTSRR